MWYWKTEINCTDCVKTAEVLHGVMEVSNILHTVKGMKGTWMGHILRNNCLLKRVIEGKMNEMVEVKGGRGIKCKLLLDEDCALLVR
jgi:hypothetical protein